MSSSPGDQVDAEQQRLNALHRMHLLETPADAALDALVRVASLGCGTPFALLSIVDKDRLWFKANVGLPGVSGLARHGSFCDQVVQEGDVMEVCDARADPRFACSTLVTEAPGIQFYAAAPVHSPDGFCIGTLCVLHQQPHRLSDAQRQILRELASAASKLMNAETALKLSETKFRTLCESSPFGVYQTDAQGACVYTNAQWQKTYGLSFEQSLGDNWAATLYPDDRPAVFAAWLASVGESHDFNMEFRILRSDGCTRYVHSQARAIRDAAGCIQGYVGAVEDVTERRLQSDRLRASEAFLDRTGRIAGVGGWQLDLASGEIYWSDQTCRIHGVAPGHRPGLEEAIGYYAPSARSVIESTLQTSIKDGHPWDLTLPFVSATGRAMWVRAVGEVEFEAGRAARLVGAFQDVTEQHERQQAFAEEQQMRQQIQAQAQQTETLLQERTEMLSVLAHEVRQPLHNASAALQSAEESLQRGGTSAVGDRLSRAQSVFSQVLSSVDNTLTAAVLLGRGTLDHTDDADLGAFIALTIADMPVTQRHRIVVQRESGIRTVSMNMGLMRIALRNLLLNALACSPADSQVLVRLSDSDHPLALLLDVWDQGPGIDAAFVPQLFQRGSRERSSSTRSGYGLGLYIVRRVMELHGGQASLLRNGPGGTCFRLSLTQSSTD